MSRLRAVKGRGILVVVAALVLSGCTAPSEPAPRETAGQQATESARSTYRSDAATKAITRLEAEYDARVGVSLIDGNGANALEYRAEERFGFASSIKAFVAAALLDTTSATERSEIVRWTREDVETAGHAPVTDEALDTGLTLDRLAEAAVRDSDNAATNIVMERLGGPDRFRSYLKTQGDDVTRVNDYEPELNDVVEGKPENTTTPAAFAKNLQRIESGEWLGEEEREVWRDWMTNNATGDSLIRAGVPDDWKVADKSGGAGGIRNDVAIVWLPDSTPLILVILTERNTPGREYDDALVADIAREVAAAM